jgi:hypothetical protein
MHGDISHLHHYTVLNYAQEQLNSTLVQTPKPTSTPKAVGRLAPSNAECEIAFDSRCLKISMRFIRIRFAAF